MAIVCLTDAAFPILVEGQAYPPVVRGEVVRQSLVWLKVRNPLYKDIEINEARLQALPTKGLLDYSIEHVQTSAHLEALESRYDVHSSELWNADYSPPPDESCEIGFSNIVNYERVSGSGIHRSRRCRPA